VLEGEASGDAVHMIYVAAPQHALTAALHAAESVDPDLFYMMERSRSWSRNLDPVPAASGWRAVAKKK
jgi:hypothetical protein